MTEFEAEIGVEFKHIRLLAKAFTMRNVKYNEITRGNNQRLEFLGDSICGFLSAEYLFRHFPLHHEGHLTLLRCTMVGASTQALVAQQLGLEQFIISRQQITQEKMGWKQKILADLMEAFIAALFIGERHGNFKYLKVIRSWPHTCRCVYEGMFLSASETFYHGASVERSKKLLATVLPHITSRGGQP